MNTQIILKSNITLPPPDISEILRYMGAAQAEPNTQTLISECIKEAEGVLFPRALYREYDIDKSDGILNLGFANTKSRDLQKNLSGCKSIFLMAATLGTETDRLLLRYSRLSPARALVLDAFFTERIEALCDALEDEITLGKRTKARFSAGYGDLPIELQRDIFSALECTKLLGLTLNRSMLISPVKSVTAIIGIAK